MVSAFDGVFSCHLSPGNVLPLTYVSRLVVIGLVHLLNDKSELKREFTITTFVGCLCHEPLPYTLPGFIRFFRHGHHLEGPVACSLFFNTSILAFQLFRHIHTHGNIQLLNSHFNYNAKERNSSLLTFISAFL